MRSLLIPALTAALVSAAVADELPDAKPVPALQILPLPDDEAAVTWNGVELTRYRFGSDQRRTFWYPLIDPGSGRSVTRMGHPHDAVSHSHHNSLWISHHIVDGIDFWGDRGKAVGRILHDPAKVKYFDQGDDGSAGAGAEVATRWVRDEDGKTLLLEKRRFEVRDASEDGWLMVIDLEFSAPGNEPATFEETPFGVIGIRMAKTIGVKDGGGRILNSEGQRNEAEVFRKPAKWVDYAGPLAPGANAGAALFDHPDNPDHPNAFHVRDDGWMGACLTLGGAIKIEPGKPLKLRYGIWVHSGAPDRQAVEAKWKAFAGAK